MTDNRREKRVLFLISAALVIMTLAAYEPIRHNSFVNYDDDKYITNNPHIKNGITKQSVTWALTKTYAYNWHPLTWLSHTVDCEIYGLNPTGHHITSVIIHIVSSVLLFLVLLRMTKATWASAFAAAVFAAHPVHVESVAWAAERKDVLSGLFWILTMLSYVRYTERPNFKRYTLVLLAFAMGLMSKPMVVTLPLVLLLLDYWPLERIRKPCFAKASSFANATKDKTQGKQKTKDAYQKESMGWLIIEKVPLLGMSVFSCVMTFIAQKSGGAVIALEKITLNDRIANVFISYIRYIGKMIWPSRLAVFYPHSHGNFSTAAVVICALIFVLISVLSIYLGRRKKYALVGWLWYVGTLVPMIGLVQVGNQAMADRYMYIPMLGLLFIIAWSVKDFIAGNRYRKVAAGVSAALALSACVILTRMQVNHWQNSITLFGHALKVTENNITAENNYGYALLEAGRLDEAVRYLDSALKRDPNLAEARINLGLALRKQGKLNEAIACFNELIERGQGSAKVYYNLVVALSEQKNYDEAIKCLSKAMALDPTYPNAQYIMGTLLASTGRLEEAIVQFNEALRTNTDKTKVYANLGMTYQRLGKYEAAIQSWSKAAELQPNDAGILNNLAWLLATVGNASIEDVKKATELAERVCKQTGYKEAVPLDTLAAAYAASGRFEDAATTAQKAIDAAKARGQEEVAGSIQKRLELYRAGQRYIQK